MDPAVVTGLSASITAVLGKLAGRSTSGRPHEAITRNIELHDRLPEKSTAKEVLLQHIDESVIRLTRDEATKRRDPSGIVLATLFIIGGIGLAYVAFQSRSWGWVWGIGAVLCVLLGATGMSQAVTKAERDGRTVDP